jgi:endonuclease/exonuclease/phosphatase family metal-dependent hydrolase
VIVTRTVDRLEPLSPKVRSELLARPPEHATFRAAFADISALHAIAVHSPPRPAITGDTARVVFWNAERLKALEPSAALLGSLGADVLILCEVDVGMARSGNRDTIAELARSVDAGFVFGVEFVELGLGDLREQRWHSGKTNVAGLHGAGFVSRARLDRPALVRLESSGRWFDGAFHERRVGGRIAMFAELTIADVPVLLVCAHYESHSDPVDRLLQTRTMLDAIEGRALGRPVLIAGDFNTSTFSLAEKQDPAIVQAALAADPHRLVDPVADEPMFDLLSERGYEWESCNVPLAPTQRMRPDGSPRPPFGKIDWLFSRGLRCSSPAVIPAVCPNGDAISDHEALAVVIAPDRPR